MFHIPPEWGDFDFADQNEQVRACEMVMAETGAMWIPIAYATANSQDQIEEFREAIAKKCSFPPCNVNKDQEMEWLSTPKPFIFWIFL